MNRALKAGAWCLAVAGTAAPLGRRRLKRTRPLAQALAYAAPASLYLLLAPGRRRAVVVCASHMWAYLSAYEYPNDRPQELRERVRVRYPLALDRLLGGGRIPSLHLQRALGVAPSRLQPLLVWTHWLWFVVPHAALAYILARRPGRFAGAAARTYAVFDLGACLHWALPTAPPWYAARLVREEGYPLDGELAALRRVMVEYGEAFWGERWGSLFRLLGGNPLAAMPSLHLATSLAAALELREVDPVAFQLALCYVLLLSLALVYLGEHYVVDLVGGVGLVLAVRVGAPVAAAPLGRLRRWVDSTSLSASPRH